MKQLYKFVNPSMEGDIVDAKGKITVYKEIYVIENSEEKARISYGEKKGPLSEDWKLVSTTELNKGK